MIDVKFKVTYSNNEVQAFPLESDSIDSALSMARLMLKQNIEIESIEIESIEPKEKITIAR